MEYAYVTLFILFAAKYAANTETAMSSDNHMHDIHNDFVML